MTTDLAQEMLLALIDNKGVFTDPVALEVPGDVVDSVKEARSMATSTEGLVDGEETCEEVHNITQACRKFMRDHDVTMSTEVLQATPGALRAEVGESLWVLVDNLSLRPTRNFDLTPCGCEGSTSWKAGSTVPEPPHSQAPAEHRSGARCTDT